jgi:hypothetical protein
VAGNCCVQFVPFQVQVSFKRPLLSFPPKSMSWPVEASYAIAAEFLAGGLAVGDCCVQPTPAKDTV